MSVSRREFIVTSAGVAGGLILARSGLGQTATTNPEGTTHFAPPGEFKAKYFGEFSELPMGSLKPGGWIKGWLERQAQGLTGHPENLAYPYDTCMFAGKVPPPPVKHGEVWWPYEQSGYFVDSAVRLSFLVDDAQAKVLPAANIKYILANSGPTHLGESTWGWPNTVVGRALMAEYSGTGNPAPAQVLMNYLLGSHVGPSRDGFVAEQAFYLYGLTADDRLLDIARHCCDRFFSSDAKSFSSETKIRGNAPLKEHGVTAAEQLKLLPLLYSYTGDKNALELAHLAYQKVLTESLMPDGGIVSSESIGPAAFNSLHETCDITDWSWSFGYMLMASGEGRWGDLIERATFNALPGAVTKDFKQVQYFSSPNQVLASSTACPRLAMTRMSYRAGHETPCCSGNVSRAMPNYVSRMWMRSQDDGLAAVLYGPCEVHTTVNGQSISIVEKTDYPFRDTIQFAFKVQQPVTFSLRLRIPQWCTKPTITVNGKEIATDASAGAFAVVKREFHDGDVVAVQLPMPVAMDEWFAGTAMTVHRGPLVYSLKVDEKRVEIQHDTDAIRRVLIGHNIEGFPAVEFYPQSQWRYGINADLKNTPEKIAVKESPMPENPFLAETVPVQLSVPLRQITQWAADWKAVLDPPPADLKQSPKNPASLPVAADLQSPGEVQMMVLVPLGSTHLRVTSLPVI